jgi:hypothetical protein
MRKSLKLSLTATFASLHTILYLMSFGLWRNWAIYLAPVEGTVLGPSIGFVAALIGSSLARMIKPDVLWMFGIIAEPVSVMMTGFLARAKWKPVLIAYAVMLAAFFAHPYGRTLPLWTILDILIALFLIYPTAKLSGNLLRANNRHLPIALVLVSFVCVATDSLVRIFLLIPCGLYSLFGSFEALYAVFVGTAVDSYIEDLIVVLVSLLAGVPVIFAVSKIMNEKTTILKA